MVINPGMVFISMWMVANMKDIGRMTIKTVMVFYISLMETCILEISLMVNALEEVVMTMRMEIFTKVNGKMTKSMDRVPCRWPPATDTKENGLMEGKMGKVNIHSLTVMNMKDISKWG